MFQQNHTCFITLLSHNTMCDIHDPFVQKQTLLLQAPYDPFLTFIITTWASFIHQNLTLNLCDWTCNLNFMKKPEPASKPQITKPVLFHNCRNSTCTILLCNLSSNLYLGNVNSIQEAFATHTNSLLKCPLNLRFISATNCYSFKHSETTTASTFHKRADRNTSWHQPEPWSFFAKIPYIPCDPPRFHSLCSWLDLNQYLSWDILHLK